ncbi:MAG: small subunit ribosomal protein S7 [Candidatus Omnitrophota bacterium]|jgi:small subunit ribosomal protein S7
MSRRRKAQKKNIVPDLKYESEMVTRFVSHMMKQGKRSVAERIIYDALEIIKEKTDGNPIEIFETAVDNIRPQLEVKSRRVGGATYQVPIEVNSDRGLALGMRWLIGFARKRRGVPMSKALANELLDAYNRTGAAVKKRDDTHKMAQANRAFAHYRW